ncbi:MAG: rhamnogalacturonan acetylesterase [Verrucomicrobiaceae bacterium]|nr:rhamnogalacturonan acetylesterase [Verrucomicrobiaceae bacterium]
MLRLTLALLITLSQIHAAEWKFHFTDGLVQPGFTRVAPDSAYDAKNGFGLLPAGTAESATFALDVDEGNYEVTLRLGHPSKATKTTVYAESRRMMLHEVEMKPGQFENLVFTVNVRKPTIAGGGVTGLKEREKGPPPVPDWDEWLTLEFVGKDAIVSAMQIRPIKEAVTVFLAGDSTVTDQPWGPFFGWGQMLPRFFKSSVAVSNHAESGLALFSFEGSRRLKKIQSMMKPGDYLFIQFGHNDQKDKSKDAGPFTTYKANLKRFITAAREKGGLPVLVSPMERRRWDRGKMETTLDDYAEAVLQVGAEEKVPVIDLHAMSIALYRALGPEASKKAFVHFPANTFPKQATALRDDTHHGAYGGYELARCMVEGIKNQLPELAKHLAEDGGSFDPTKPDDASKVIIPWNVNAGPTVKPDGN